jgi:hypothetical protein
MPGGIFIYWSQWFTRDIYRYNTELELWHRLDPDNLEELNA